MTRVQFVVMTSIPTLDMENREDIAVTAYRKGLNDQDAEKLAALQSEGKVAKGMKIAVSGPAFSTATRSKVASTGVHREAQSRPHECGDASRRRSQDGREMICKNWMRNSKSMMSNGVSQRK